MSLGAGMMWLGPAASYMAGVRLSKGPAEPREVSRSRPGLDSVELSGRRGSVETFWSQVMNRPSGVPSQEFLSVAARTLGSLTWDWLKKTFPETADDEHQAVFALLVMLREISPFSYSHSNRVADLAVSLGEELELSEEELDLLYTSAQLKDAGQLAMGLAAMSPQECELLASDIRRAGVSLESAGSLHDIGKVYVPPGILTKRGPLTASEREIVELHPVVGEQLLKPLPSLAGILPAVRGHHERCDGEGYPDGLASFEIPLTARILCLADCYDAMTGDRPYRQSLRPEDALGEILRNSGSQFDPELSALFVRRVARDL